MYYKRFSIKDPTVHELLNEYCSIQNYEKKNFIENDGVNEDVKLVQPAPNYLHISDLTH